MFLSRREILEYLRSNRLRFDPAVSEDRVAQVSIDLSLGRRFTQFKEKPGFISAVYIDPSLWDSKDLWEECKETEEFLLKPGAFVLAQTLEKVFIPNELVGLVEGRSSYARIGITVHVTAPKIDPGFNTHITLEMANFGKLPVALRAGIDRPAQLLLATLSSPVDDSELYGTNLADIFQHHTEPIPRSRKS